MYFYDWTFILLLPALILSFWAQNRVKSAYKKYSDIYSKRQLTGAQIARDILDQHQLTYIAVEPSPNQGLSDHYDPKSQTVRLSQGIINSTSLAAIGIAAHECGHAIQHSEEYGPIKVRNAIVPVVNFGSKAAIPLVLVGLIFSIPQLAFIGIIAYSLAVVFQLITLPVELDASRRALAVLDGYNYLDNEEIIGAKKVLNAAAMTYLAAALAAILNLLRLILISKGGRRRR